MMAGLTRRVLMMGAGACALAVLAACSPKPAAPDAAKTGGDRVFVSDERGNSITVIDAATGATLATIPVGKRPRGIMISPDGTKLYIALSGSAIAGPGVDEDSLPPPDREADGIGVINLADLSVGTTIKAGNDPEAFAISPDGSNLFISNEDTSEVSIVNLNSGQIRASIKVGGEPEGAAVSPDGKFVLVACEAAGAVYVIDVGQTKVAGIIPVSGRPRALAFTADGRFAYVTNENTGKVSMLDIAARKIAAVIDIPDVGAGADAAAPAAKASADVTAKGGSTSASTTAPRPMGLVFSPDRSKLYVTTGRGKSVGEIDTATNKVTRMIKDVGERPWGITISKDGKFLYTANGPSNDISVIDLASGAVAKRIPSGASPWGVAYEGRS